MSSSIGIQSITNLHTGTTAQVALSGVPVGPLTFYAARVPYVSQAASVPFTGSGPYIVTLPHAQLWYLWAHDNNGFGDAFDGVWIGVTDNPDLDECGFHLRTILRDNEKGFNTLFKTWYPDTTLKQVEYGLPDNVIEFPSIVITNARAMEEWVGTSYLKQVRLQFDIAFLAVHVDEQTELPLITRFLRAGMKILNQPYYNNTTLPSGLEISMAEALEGEATEFDLGEEIGVVSAASAVWTCLTNQLDAGN